MPEAGKPTGKIYLKISFYGEDVMKEHERPIKCNDVYNNLSPMLNAKERGNVHNTKYYRNCF